MNDALVIHNRSFRILGGNHTIYLNAWFTSIVSNCHVCGRLR